MEPYSYHLKGGGVLTFFSIRFTQAEVVVSSSLRDYMGVLETAVLVFSCTKSANNEARKKLTKNCYNRLRFCGQLVVIV